MRVTHDSETDSMIITLREEPIRESDEIGPGVIADFGTTAASSASRSLALRA